MAEFETPEDLVKAASAAYSFGYRRIEAFSPFPVEELAEAIGFHHDSVALITLIGGTTGGVLAFLMQWYANVIDYPINVAGHPYFSWPAFIPVTFELTVLGAALSAAFGMLALNRLPKPWHPVFNSMEFSRASRDRFFLCIKASDPLFNSPQIQQLLGGYQLLSLKEVKIEE